MLRRFFVQRDEKDTAAVYEEFLKDFGGEGSSGTFVRAGVIEPGKRGTEEAPPGQKRQVYSFSPAVASVFGDEESRDEAPAPEVRE